MIGEVNDKRQREINNCYINLNILYNNDNDVAVVSRYIGDWFISGKRFGADKRFYCVDTNENVSSWTI